MIVVPAKEITPASIVSSNLPVNDYAVWNNTTAYVVGDKVTLDNINYEALVDNTGVSPATDRSTPKKWLRLGWTNRMSMFVKRIGNTWPLGTFTSNPEEIDTTIAVPGRINSIGFVGLQGSQIELTMTVGEEVIYSYTETVQERAAGSWWRYFFAPFQYKSNIARLDLPPVIGANLRIRVLSPGGVARVGMVVVGVSQKIGNASWGSRVGFDNYSNLVEDDFGNISIVERGKKDWQELEVVIKTENVPTMLRTLSNLKDSPALYIGSTRVTPTIMVGKFDRINLLLDNYEISEYVLEIRSII